MKDFFSRLWAKGSFWKCLIITVWLIFPILIAGIIIGGDLQSIAGSLWIKVFKKENTNPFTRQDLLIILFILLSVLMALFWNVVLPISFAADYISTPS